jgi:RHS repeat-associated protein
MIRGARLFVVVVVAIGALGLHASKPAKLPPGQGKYLMVLWDAGTPVPGSTTGEKVQKIPEPDLDKIGGKLLHKTDNRRIITLPLGVAKQLRKHQAVVYLQRLWQGESLEGWDETIPAAALQVRTDADVDLTWGPENYTYDGSGNVTAIGGDSFVYDAVGRLKQATVNGKTESYTYDAFGNLLQKGLAGGGTTNVPVDSASNRLSGQGYDAAGNVTTHGGRADYQYDSLSMMFRSRNGRRMIYDANDERIGTIMDSSLSRWTMRDFDGQIIREFKADSIGTDMIWYWHLDHFRGEGALLAGESQQWGYFGDTWGGKRQYHLDHVGSVRMVTDSQGRSLSEHDFYPFGVSQTKTYQEQIDWGDPHIDAMRFAGQWRDFLGWLDVENSDYLDYMHARYYDPNNGRFLSVDPAGASVLAARPQTWNRYSYATNSPLVFIDPSGRIIEFADAWAKSAFEQYKQSLDPNSEDYANVVQLELSNMVYVINLTGLQNDGSKKEGEVTFDGTKVWLNIDSGGPAQDASRQSRFAHEIQHGVQVDEGRLGFHKVDGQWGAFFGDVNDEVEAWNAQLRQATDLDFHRGNIRDYQRATDKARFLTQHAYTGYSGKEKQVWSSIPVPGYKPGDILSSATLYYRIP